VVAVFVVDVEAVTVRTFEFTLTKISRMEHHDDRILSTLQAFLARPCPRLPRI